VGNGELEREIEALDEGRASVTLEGFRTVEVGGADAAAWLQDLVTADVLALAPGQAVRSLLLGPTGRIRADLHVFRPPEGFLLFQALDQPSSVDDLLAPYVLSSDVTLRERPVPDLVAVPAIGGWTFAPAGGEGHDRVSAAALEAWRIRRGVARFPVDLDEDSLPAEAGLDDGVVIDRVKGCYLGQESVAKVRNLGHPARIALGLRADEAVRPGDPVLGDGSEAGVVTSVEAPGSAGAVIARVRWTSRDAELRTARGAVLRH
jgi:folate-binding protein YgfZ